MDKDTLERLKILSDNPKQILDFQLKFYIEHDTENGHDMSEFRREYWFGVKPPTIMYDAFCYSCTHEMQVETDNDQIIYTVNVLLNIKCEHNTKRKTP